MIINYKRILFFLIIFIISGSVGVFFLFRIQNKSISGENGWWQPHTNEKLTWQWQLSTPVDINLAVDMYDVDLFDVSKKTIATLKKQNKIVICYFSAGTFESGRPDSQQLKDISPNVLGSYLADWPKERWLDITNQEVKAVMSKRMDLAVNKGCDGVEPDNVNAWEEDANGDEYITGFKITEEQQIIYNRWLANQAHSRGLSIGLKNDIGINGVESEHLANLVEYFDWALNEQCYEYNECDVYDIFDNANKAVFGVEYNQKVADFCERANKKGHYWMEKHYDLGVWRKACQETSIHPLRKFNNWFHREWSNNNF